MGFYYHWTHFLGLRNIFEFFEFLALLGPLWGNEVFKKFQKNLFSIEIVSSDNKNHRTFFFLFLMHHR